MKKYLAISNPRRDRFLPIVKKVHKEVEAFLIKQIPYNAISIKVKVSEIFFKEAQNADDFNSVVGSCEKYSNNNLYAFMTDLIAISRAKMIIEELGLFVDNYARFFTDEYKENFPYTAALIKKRKFQELINDLNTIDECIFEVSDHIDDMLEMPSIRAAVSKMPSTMMTFEEFHTLKVEIASIEAKLNLSSLSKGGLKEVNWESIKDKEFKSPITAKKPPYPNVLPSGSTFVEGKNFKWVDIGHSSSVYNFSKTNNDNRLNAPYECFYVRHCGRDYGNTLLSLRIKMGDGWYPIAMATLKYRTGAYNDFQITQLKTYANNNHWNINAQGVNWLSARGVNIVRDKMGVSPEDDLYQMIKALILSPKVAAIFDDHDVNLTIFKDDDEVIEKLKSEFHQYFMYQNSPSLIIGKVLEVLEEGDKSFVNLSSIPKLKDYIEKIAFTHFLGLLKQKFPEFTGNVSMNTINKNVVYNIEIKKFADLYEAEDFYWNRFPELKQDRVAGSGERDRYSPGQYQPYVERFIYLAPPEKISIRAYFNYNQISLPHVEDVMGESIETFKKRWSSYFANRKNPDCKKAGMSKKERDEYNEKNKSNVKKGVTNITSLEKLKRWGSWATRFYGRKDKPALVKKGNLTPLSCTSLAWGRNTPLNWREAGKIYQDGLKALKIYKELKDFKRPFSKKEIEYLNKTFLDFTK